jgi:hypothetical protein
LKKIDLRRCDTCGSIAKRGLAFSGNEHMCFTCLGERINIMQTKDLEIMEQKEYDLFCEMVMDKKIPSPIRGDLFKKILAGERFRSFLRDKGFILISNDDLYTLKKI